MRRQLFVLSVLLAVSGLPSRALSQPPPAAGLDPVDAAPIILGERLTLRSRMLDAEVTMKIWLPESFAQASPDHTYPVVFVSGMHGEMFFDVLAGMVKHLASRERMPESIVVSLDSLGPTPTVHTNGMWPRRETLGGADAPEQALAHLEYEVFPFLARTYRANDHRTIIGVSGSSLFPIYTFTHAPGLFDAHVLIAVADMVGMGYEAGTTFADTFASVLTAHPELRPRLYVGVAGDDVEKRSDHRQSLDAFARRLGGIAHLDLRLEVISGTDHYAVLIPAVRSALDLLYPKAQWSARYRDLVAQDGDALDNLDRYYAALSASVGFTVLPRANRWNNVNSLRFITRHLIGLGRTAEAVRVAQRRVAYRPRTPAARSGLADALEADGQLTAAVAAQEAAVRLAAADDSGLDAAAREALAARLASLRAAHADEAVGGGADP